ncbi:MAG: decarboxylase [Alphaproteobacteria bacterium]|nr:decarboxylase [Alphaproteobacteria bacterium]
MTGVPPSGARIIAALKSAGVGFVVAVPDIVTSDGLLWPISRDPDFRLVRMCKEDEGVAICTGLAFSGRRSVMLIQQTGFLDSINAIRAVGVEYEQPVVMLVGLQGKEPGVAPSKSKKVSVNIVEPILDTMGIARHLVETDADVEAVAPAIENAYAASRPVCVLIGQPPTAAS